MIVLLFYMNEIIAEGSKSRLVTVLNNSIGSMISFCHNSQPYKEYHHSNNINNNNHLKRERKKGKETRNRKTQ